MNPLVIFVLLLPLVAGCHSPSIKLKSDADITNWAKDKYGCLSLRSSRLAEKLIIKYHLINSTIKEALNVFSTPNIIDYSDKSEIFVYYFAGPCNTGKLIEAGDKCYLRLYFKKNRLVTTQIPCE